VRSVGGRGCQAAAVIDQSRSLDDQAKIQRQKSLKSCGRQLGVAHRVLNILVTQVGLQRGSPGSGAAWRTARARLLSPQRNSDLRITRRIPSVGSVLDIVHAQAVFLRRLANRQFGSGTSRIGRIGGKAQEPGPMSIRPFLNGVRFDDQQIEAMDSAFEAATGVLRVRSSAPPIVRKVIAARIIEAAKDGQRDPNELCKLALRALKA
jgi:hypothetical protein